MSKKINLSRKNIMGKKIIKTRNTSSTYLGQIKYGFQSNNENEESNDDLEEQTENEEQEEEEQDEDENIEEQDKNNYTTETEESDTLNKIYKLKQQLEKITTNVKKAKKTAKKAKFIKPLIIGILILLILFVIVIIATLMLEYQLNSYEYLSGQCQTITVINTDCDNYGNCSNKYDGDVSFEDYIAGVVAAETESSVNNLEYYKAIAVTARTYFYNNFQSDCQVEGNSNYQKYIDVEDSESSTMIQQAVEETKGLAMVKENMFITSDYSNACIVDVDNEYYYLRYGSLTLEEPSIQKITKEWSNESVYSKILENTSIDKNNNDNYNKDCPENNNDYGMSKVGALYLITEEGKSYEETLKYYYGEDIEIKNINISNSEMINGFINPVNNSSCTSAYECRIDPLNGQYDSHSGIDLGARSGEPVYATKPGKIVSVTKSIPGYSEKNSYGNNILIDHGDGTKTRYAHLLYGSIPNNIVTGATVEQGEEIGQVGATGRVTGPHLHYEVYLNNSLQNPVDYLDLSNIGNTNKCNSNNVPLSSCGL